MHTRSTITCPYCGRQETEIMPVDACQFYYDCKGCRLLLRPLAGHCCVFCSFGSVACPPVQQACQAGEAAEPCCNE